MTCTMGAAPASLVVLPIRMVMCEGPPAATIMDHKPIVNIPTFGVCKSPANPVVAAATAAAMGVLTPMPCVPATMSPWMVGAPTVMIKNEPALDNVSKCMCTWAGMISFSNPGTAKTMIP